LRLPTSLVIQNGADEVDAITVFRHGFEGIP